MEFRKGDVVTIEGVVDFLTSNGKIVYVKPSTGEAQAFKPEAIKLVRRAFQVGERVHVESEGGGVILAIHEDEVWIKFDIGNGASTWQLADCAPEMPPTLGETFVDGRRVPPPKPQPLAKGKVPEPSMDAVTYTVVEGDTLEGLANTFETSMDTIRISNPAITDHRFDAPMMPGQVLTIQDNRIPF